MIRPLKITLLPCVLGLWIGLSALVWSPSNLDIRLASLQKDPSFAKGTLGFLLTDVKTGSVLKAVNADIPLSPASSLKLFVCAAALDQLGPTFQFTTSLRHTGVFDPTIGEIKGDLVIRGEGDPSLNSRFMTSAPSDVIQRWVLKLKDQGIKRITGKVIADATLFEDSLAPSSWPEGDVGNYYGAGACGINYRDNAYRLYFKTGTAGTKAELLRSDPRIPGMNIETDVRSAGSSDQAYIYGREYTYERKVKGSLPPNMKNYDIDGSMPDPALYLAYVMDSILRKEGISTNGFQTQRLYKADLGSTKELFTYQSPRLDSIVAITLRHSHNLYAESLLKYLGYRSEGKGSRAGGIKSLTAWLQQKGVDTKGYAPLDGSGLSPDNKVTMRQFCGMLNAFGATDRFLSILPGLKKHGPQVMAKSGYISGVRSYAGYVKTQKGEWKSFALVVNGYTCSPKEARVKLEQILSALNEI